jgi:hypothetical protein
MNGSTGLVRIDLVNLSLSRSVQDHSKRVAQVLFIWSWS